MSRIGPQCQECSVKPGCKKQLSTCDGRLMDERMGQHPHVRTAQAKKQNPERQNPAWHAGEKLLEDLPEKQALYKEQPGNKEIDEDLIARIQRQEAGRNGQYQAGKCPKVQVILPLIQGCIAEDGDILSSFVVVGIGQGKKGRIRLLFQEELAAQEGAGKTRIIIARIAA